MKRFIRVLAVAGVLAFAASARADFSVGLDREFSGATAPEGATPWLTATITDVATDTVRITLDATHLTDAEFVSIWDFNVAGAAGATGLSLNNYSDSDIASTTISFGSDAYKADGDGYFDLSFSWGNGQFTAGDSAWFEFTRSGLTADDFNDLSLGSGNSPDGLVTAAHVQAIGPSNSQSGWITGTPTTTTTTEEAPIPGALMLASAGLGIVGFVRRRRA